MSVIRSAVPKRVLQSGFLNSDAALRAKERWLKRPGIRRVLAKILQNWRSNSASSSVHFEVAHLRHADDLRALSQAIKIEQDIYRPTGYGLAIMVVLSVEGGKRFAGVCARAYEILRKVYLAAPDRPVIAGRALKEQLGIDDAELKRVALILADFSVATLSTEADPQMHVYHSIRDKADIWAVLDSNLMMFAQPTYPSLGEMNPFAAFGQPGDRAYGVVGICPEALDDCVKAHERLLRDPPGAITSARSMLESAVKWIHHQYGSAPSKDGSTGRRLKDCLKLMDMEDGDFEKPGVKLMITGMETAVNGLDSARNVMSDGHGKSPIAPLANTRISQLVVSLATSVTQFLLSTYESRQRP